MPLLDHFHPPLHPERHWEGFHSQWAGCITGWLNKSLPERYYAEPQTHIGSRVEIDVATFDDPRPHGAHREEPTDGGVATLVAEPQVWAPPAPDAVIPALFPDSIEILVYSTDAGATLVAAIELVSPSNKDRSDERQAFVAKCATYLHSGVGLIVIDIVTNRRANLHNHLLAFLGHAGTAELPDAALFAAAYRPVRSFREPKATTGVVEIWTAGFAVGGTLPRLFLPLDREQFAPVDFEVTYTEARQRMRLG